MKKLFTLIAALVCSVCVNAQTRTTLWEGSKTFDTTWPSIAIPTSEFATAKVGDKIIVTVEKLTIQLIQDGHMDHKYLSMLIGITWLIKLLVLLLMALLILSISVK